MRSLSLVLFLSALIALALAVEGIVGMVIKPIKTPSGATVCKIRLRDEVKLRKGDKVFLFSAAEQRGEGEVAFLAKGYAFLKMLKGECKPGLSVRLSSHISISSSHPNSEEKKVSSVEGAVSQRRSSSREVKVRELPPVTIDYSRKPVKDPYADVHIPMDKINDGMRYYTDILAKHTAVIKFGGKERSRGVRIHVDPYTLMDLYFTYSQIRYANQMNQILGGLNYPGMDSFNAMLYLGLLSQLWGLFNHGKQMGSVEDFVGPALGAPPVMPSYIMVVYLDEHVAMGRTIFHAYKETIYDENYLKRYYVRLLERSKVNELAVFKVEIFNGSPAPLNLAPFAYRMYLIGANGKRYKAVKYDPQLDNQVPPRGKVGGFVYFPKYDMVTGERLVKGRVKISIEEIGPIRQKVITFR